jgi:hypothetical protein
VTGSEVSLTDFTGPRCPNDHYIGRGSPLREVSWLPCACPPATRQGVEKRGGRGHIQVVCKACRDVGMTTVFYDPPHEPDSSADSSASP